MAAVLAVAGCQRAPQPPPAAAPAGTATTRSAPVTSGAGPRLGAIVHHTDAGREWAYDRGSPIGRLERGLDEAAAPRWIVVDMKQDWRVIYPEEAAR